MANAILDAVWLNRPFLRDLTSTEFLALVYLADKADARHRECWVTQPRMALDLGVSERQVRNLLGALRVGGFIHQTRCRGETCAGKPHRSTPHYRVMPLPGERVLKRAPESQARAVSEPHAPKRPRGRPRKVRDENDHETQENRATQAHQAARQTTRTAQARRAQTGQPVYA